MPLLDVKGGAERHAEQRQSLSCAQLVGQGKAERSCLVWSQLQKDPRTWWLREGRSLAGDPLLLSLSSYNTTSSQFSLSQLSTLYALLHPHPCNHQLSAALCTKWVVQVCYPHYTITIHTFLQGVECGAKRGQRPTSHGLSLHSRWCTCLHLDGPHLGWWEVSCKLSLSKTETD